MIHFYLYLSRRYRESSETTRRKFAYAGFFIEQGNMDEVLNVLNEEYPNIWGLNENEVRLQYQRLTELLTPFLMNESDFYKTRHKKKIERGFLASVVYNLFNTNFIGFADTVEIFNRMPDEYFNYLNLNDFGQTFSSKSASMEHYGFSRFITEENLILRNRKEDLLQSLENVIFTISENSPTILNSYTNFKEHMLSDNVLTPTFKV